MPTSSRTAEMYTLPRSSPAKSSFNRDVAALYADVGLQAAFPDLVQRCRLPLDMAGMKDLGVAVPEAGSPDFGTGELLEIGTALGWLYIAANQSILRIVTLRGLETGQAAIVVIH